MSPRKREWVGLALVAVSVACTLWLAFAGKLTLYIHPRYVVFTIAMAGIALVLTASAVRGAENRQPARSRGALVGVIGAVVAIIVAGGMLIFPPATLTTATADQRELNSTTIGANAQSVESVNEQSGLAFTNFTVVDWSSLLRQTSDPAFYSGKSVDVVGFVTRSDEDSQNIFYISRFIITCCAVDAQPVGVPVYHPGWTASFAEGDWVQLAGEFGSSLSAAAGPSVVLYPDSIRTVEEPDEPYLF